MAFSCFPQSPPVWSLRAQKLHPPFSLLLVTAGEAHRSPACLKTVGSIISLHGSHFHTVIFCMCLLPSRCVLLSPRISAGHPEVTGHKAETTQHLSLGSHLSTWFQLPVPIFAFMSCFCTFMIITLPLTTQCTPYDSGDTRLKAETVAGAAWP